MSYDLSGKVVLVTGGASGIGSFIVRYALEEGAKHVAILDVSENGTDFAKELNKQHGAGKAKFYKCDVTDEKLLKGILEEVKKQNGYLDVVVNNAGIMNDSLESYKKEIEINFLALVTSTLKCLEIMREDEGGKGGTVINISSVAALVQMHILPIYLATKSAVLQFSNCIGMDAYYSKTKVRVLTACFGPTSSSLFNREKFGNFDKAIEDTILDEIKVFQFQKMESAAKGIIEMYKQGKSASTWLIQNDKPAKDVSEYIKNGYKAFADCLVE